MLDLQECSRLLLNSILGGFRFGAWPFRRFKYRFPEKERRDQGISARHAFERLSRRHSLSWEQVRSLSVKDGDVEFEKTRLTIAYCIHKILRRPF